MVQDIGALLDAIAVNNIDTTGAAFISDAGTVGVLKSKVGRASTLGCSRRSACRQKPSCASRQRRLFPPTPIRRKSKFRKSLLC
jgi:hypothetical protein